MSLRKVKLIQGEYFHIYNRGNDKKVIFKDKEDYDRFIGLMYACNQVDSFKIDNLQKDEGLFNVKRQNTLVSIGAYCLMPNHFHIILIQTEDEGISKFMKKLLTAYVMYFNKKYERTGSLFEGKFKAEHAGNDRYLKYLYSYIHLNPIKLIDRKWKEEGIKNKNESLKYLNQYKYSSYLDYLGENRVQSKILNIDSFPKYFSSNKSFKDEIFEWLLYKD
ncbi:MAG: transposase [Candidatus Pacebacteria bacterium]|nr:transposase [Candidatus Paceibacterota bacterium]